MKSNQTIYSVPLLRRLCRSALLAASLLLTGGLTACHQSIAPSEEELVGSCEQAVRITARVSPFGGAPAGTRADVDGKVDNEHTDPWQPESKDPAQNGEVRLSRLYVFVTKRGSDKVEKTLYYYAEDYDHEDVVKDPSNPGNFIIEGTEIPARQFTNPSAGGVSMDMTLLPGDYTFLLVANCGAATDVVNETKQLKVSDLNQLFHDGNSFVTVKGYDEYTYYDYNFPMLGYRDLTVPATPEPGKRVDLTPEIPLERQVARIDVTLTTATDESRTSYLSVDKEGTHFEPSQYRLTQFLVLECVDVSNSKDKKLYPYTLFPVEGAFTALPAGLPKYPRDGYTPPVILDDDGTVPRRPWASVEAMVYSDNQSANPFWKRDINNGSQGLRKLWRQSLIYMYSNGSALSTDYKGGPSYMYLPSVYFGNVSDPNKVVRLQLKFKKLDGTETLTYRIPIHNEEDASDYYSIRRNTIYHIDLTFYGSKLEVQQSGIKVLPWKVENETMEVDIDDATTPPVIPIKK